MYPTDINIQLSRNCCMSYSIGKTEWGTALRCSLPCGGRTHLYLFWECESDLQQQQKAEGAQGWEHLSRDERENLSLSEHRARCLSLLPLDITDTVTPVVLWSIEVNGLMRCSFRDLLHIWTRSFRKENFLWVLRSFSFTAIKYLELVSFMFY